MHKASLLPSIILANNSGMRNKGGIKTAGFAFKNRICVGNSKSCENWMKLNRDFP